jgi:hypothetical protein
LSLFNSMNSMMQQRLKSIQVRANKWATYPFLPGDARALIAETVLLLADLVQRIEQLEKATGK